MLLALHRQPSPPPCCLLRSSQTIFKTASGVAPKKYVELHGVSITKFVAIDLHLEEVLGWAIAAGVGLFLLGFYGVQGDFKTVYEGERRRVTKRRAEIAHSSHIDKQHRHTHS